MSFDEVLLDPPPDRVDRIDTTDPELVITEVTVPYAVDTGMDPTACALRELAGCLQESAAADRHRVVHSIQITYERDPFSMVLATMVHGPDATQA